MIRQAKSAWVGLAIHNARHQEAVRSWFAGMIRDDETIVSARTLNRLSDDSPIKLKVIVKVGENQTREFVRTFGRRFSIFAKSSKQVTT